MENNNSGCLILVIIAAVMMVLIGSCSSSNTKERELAAWDTQMNKDPSTWSKEEIRRYEDFMDWVDKQ